MIPQDPGPSTSWGSDSQPSQSALSAAQVSEISIPGLPRSPFLYGKDNSLEQTLQKTAGMEGVCYQEQEVQPYLDTGVTCNLIETGREVMGLLTRPGDNAVGCLSPGQHLLGSEGMSSSAFSPGRRGKGQTSCREQLVGSGLRLLFSRGMRWNSSLNSL